MEVTFQTGMHKPSDGGVVFVIAMSYFIETNCEVLCSSVAAYVGQLLEFCWVFSYCELYLFIGSDRKGIKNNMDTHVAALFFTYIELMWLHFP